MIDPSVYNLTEEEVRLILSNVGLLGFFYIFGVCMFTFYVLYYGIKYTIKGYQIVKSHIKSKKGV